ncbi:hypothetical protein FVE85_4439 [Porphyridium purpureum]|uniref:Uncharacterized protein n=1 Tax=Porphyridium purpureum TaxID=35688 RepID=A0A5J4YIZ5_PORPP|nr:hypothetical protein FVE85_4439 [Porphyridium purpureum]|eukprot:POR2876..scf297_16
MQSEQDGEVSEDDVFVTPPSSPGRRLMTVVNKESRLSPTLTEHVAAVIAQLQEQKEATELREREYKLKMEQAEAQCTSLREEIAALREEMALAQRATVAQSKDDAALGIERHEMHEDAYAYERERQLWDEKERALRATIEFLFAQLQAANTTEKHPKR